MTDLPGEADDQRAVNDPDPGPVGPVPPTPAPPQFGSPGFAPGYGPPAGYPPPVAPPRRPGGSRTGLVVATAVGLVAVLGVGVVIGLAVSGGGSSTGAAPASTPASPSQVPPATTTARPSAPPGPYSMKTIANACDLIDPTPLTKWSSTPTSPTHQELPPSDGYGGALTCNLDYTNTSPVDGVTTDEAGIGVSVEFTSAGQPPGYDQWNDTAQPGWSTGTIPGLGARNRWRGIAGTDPSPGANYVIAVQDANVSVKVQVAVLRARGEAPPKLDDLSAIGESQMRAVLDRLKQP
ncbi:hypothetical protein [Kutzneria sp. NPDC052558]|uniref:hypothetical protein n=1 Tax=Kutzneria sp. NPDC052558 TaxID=3364121 RepID=UPI0037CC48E5